MARSKPRLTVTLDQRVYDYLKQAEINASGTVNAAVLDKVDEAYINEAHREAERRRAAEERRQAEAEAELDDLDAADTEADQ